MIEFIGGEIDGIRLEHDTSVSACVQWRDEAGFCKRSPFIDRIPTSASRNPI